MTLTIQDLGALGELLGSVAVLATLVYLALQTRQNTAAIAAQLEADRFAATVSLDLALATSAELQDALREDLVDDATTNNDMRRNVLWTTRMNLWSLRFHQGRQGLLPRYDTTWSEESLARIVLWHFSRFRSSLAHWDARKTGYPPEFVEWVEEQRSKAA